MLITGNEYDGTATNDVAVYLINVSGSTIHTTDIDTADYGIIDYGVITAQNTVTNTGPNANSYTLVDLVNHYLELDPATQTTVVTPVGSEGDDLYIGGAGIDTLTGNGGDDYLQGRGGADTMLGGDGDDTIVWTAGDGNDTSIDGGADNDTLELFDTAGSGHDPARDRAARRIVGLGGGTANVTGDRDGYARCHRRRRRYARTTRARRPMSRSTSAPITATGINDDQLRRAARSRTSPAAPATTR